VIYDMNMYRTSSSEIGSGAWTDAPVKIDDQGARLVRPDGELSEDRTDSVPLGGEDRNVGGVRDGKDRSASRGVASGGATQKTTGTISWKDAEFRYEGTYTGGLKDGVPHGQGDFAQEGGRKHLIGEWVDGVKQGPFVRRYLNGFKWVGNYVNDLREGEVSVHPKPITQTLTLMTLALALTLTLPITPYHHLHSNPQPTTTLSP
jgi:hypothetical protein